MKPTFPFTDSPAGRNSFGAGRACSRSLQTDFHFQAGNIDTFAGCCSGGEQPSFRGISADYFRDEARRHFRSEAAFFAVIVATVAIPVAQSIYALATLVYTNL